MHLLGDIIGHDIISNKYSIAYNNLKAVIELERLESEDKIPNALFDMFNNISETKDNLSSNTPLLILEQYYMRNMRNLNKEVYIEHDNNGYSIKVSDLYLILEEFYIKIYMLAVTIADFYNIEYKLKKQNLGEENYI